jgi:hypothetical protein
MVEGSMPDFTSFDPQQAACWEMLGRTWAAMFGFIPTNDQFIAMSFMLQNMQMNMMNGQAGQVPEWTAAPQQEANGFTKEEEQPVQGREHANANANDDMDMSVSSEDDKPSQIQSDLSFANPLEASSKSKGGKMRKVNGSYVFVANEA